MTSSEKTEWTLTDAARVLGEPQHRLIYLCEKSVVRPDFQNAGGRGSSRRFSVRNLLEFAIALELREFEIPATVIAPVLHVIRSFEREVAQTRPGFHLPKSLRSEAAPDLRLIISDGHTLFFTMRSGSGALKVFGGIQIQKVGESVSGKAGSASEFGLAKLPRHLPPSEFGGPEGSRHARVELSITRVAQDLKIGD